MSTEKVAGAKFNFTVTALIEGIWFGLGMILIPGIYYQITFPTEATVLELYAFRVIGIMALALAIGCWYARTADIGEVKMMSLIMIIAKVGSTILLIGMMVGAGAQSIGYLNPILTALLAILNIRQYMSVASSNKSAVI